MCQMAEDHLDDEVTDGKDQHHIEWDWLAALQYFLDGHLDDSDCKEKEEKRREVSEEHCE